jgi:hypothetical protein
MATSKPANPLPIGAFLFGAGGRIVRQTPIAAIGSADFFGLQRIVKQGSVSLREASSRKGGHQAGIVGEVNLDDRVSNAISETGLRRVERKRTGPMRFLPERAHPPTHLLTSP